MQLLRPPFYAQEKDSSCLAACLRMVLAAYGSIHSEKQLRDLCDWTPQRSIFYCRCGSGTGLRVHTYSRGLRLATPRSARPVAFGNVPNSRSRLASNGLSGQHAQVVASLTSRGLRINDPLMGQITSGLLVFEQAWSESDFLAIIIE